MDNSLIKLLNLFILFKLTLQLMQEYHLNINDILNENLMPASLLLLDEPSKNLSVINQYNYLNNSVNASDTKDNSDFVNIIDGTFNKALSTMGFHRSMMEKYMCNNFIAEQILTDFVPTSIQHRLGMASLNSNSNDKLTKNIQEVMRFDQGSTAYKNWLAKTTTLEDIHNHISPTQQIVTAEADVDDDDGKSRHSKLKRNDFKKLPSKRYDQIVNYNTDDYEEVDITGYAVEEPMKHNLEFRVPELQNYETPRHQPNNFPLPIAGSKTGQQINSYNLENDQRNLFSPYYEQGIFTDITTTNPILEHLLSKKKNLLNNNPFRKLLEHIKSTIFSHKEGYKHGGGYSHSGSGYNDFAVQNAQKDSSKEMSLKDLFDIALTTLAFLSFGMFILQVIMCVTMTKNDNSMMMMPMEVEELDMNAEIRRKKRSLDMSSFTQINEISKNILRSIDAAVYAKNDNGKCLQHTICANNKFSRNRKDNQKIWMPLWGLGMSWISSRLIPQQQPTISILNGIRASVMGLGNGSCKKLFPCNVTENMLKTKDFDKIK